MCAQGGGVLCNNFSGPVLENIIFRDNAADSGGALSCKYSSPTVINCTFMNNEAMIVGGAIHMTGSSPVFYDCTIYGNDAADNGGGVYCFSSDPAFHNCIIAYNGLESIYCFDEDSQPTLTCSNIYGNELGDWIDRIESQYGVNGNICADPLFCDPENGILLLRSDSPCTSENSPCGQMGAWPVGCEPTAVEGQPETRFALRLAPGSPNPFRASTDIRFAVPTGQDGARVQLRVYDAGGRLVRTLVDGSRRGGSHTVSWDGTNGAGTPVAGGVYYYQLVVRGQRQTKHVILAK